MNLFFQLGDLYRDLVVTGGSHRAFGMSVRAHHSRCTHLLTPFNSPPLSARRTPARPTTALPTTAPPAAAAAAGGSATALSAFGAAASPHSSSTFHCCGDGGCNSATNAVRKKHARKPAHHPQSQLYPMSKWSFVMWWRASSGSLKSSWLSSGQSRQ
jgi:hypothetical protein